MHPRESDQQVKEAGTEKERKQSKGAIAGKASGKLQLIPQGNSGVDVTSQELSHWSSCAVISGHLPVQALNFSGTYDVVTTSYYYYYSELIIIAKQN